MFAQSPRCRHIAMTDLAGCYLVQCIVGRVAAEVRLVVSLVQTACDYQFWAVEVVVYLAQVVDFDIVTSNEKTSEIVACSSTSLEGLQMKLFRNVQLELFGKVTVLES